MLDDAAFPARIPIFPLPLVFFPGQVQALRIFEPRYRAMLLDCVQTHTPFGIVLARPARSADQEARPCAVGALAHIMQVEQQPDDTYAIQVRGGQRFHITEFLHDKSYLQGRIVARPMQQVDSDLSARLSQRVGQLLIDYASALSKAAGVRIGAPERSSDPERLAYLAAMMLQISVEEKQSLLEITDLPQLLSVEIDRLRAELDLMAWIIASLGHDQAHGFGTANALSLN